MKEEPIRAIGKISEIFKGDQFAVILDSSHRIIAKPSGKMRQCKIKLAVGDTVDVEISVYDVSKGRIVYRK